MMEDDLKKLFNRFPGNWILEREIISGGDKTQFSGHCVFNRLTGYDRIICHEDGVLALPNGVQQEAFRSYIYQYQYPKILILYNDPHRSGEVLHELDFSKDNAVYSASHCHFCGQDQYHLDFTVRDNVIEMTYIVQGPQKDYRMHTTLTPDIK